MKILLVEDDSAICSILTHIIIQNGHEVSACMLLRKSALLLADNPFDLIVCDIGLPDGNWLAFCGQQIKIPFVITSGPGC